MEPRNAQLTEAGDYVALWTPSSTLVRERSGAGAITRGGAIRPLARDRDAAPAGLTVGTGAPWAADA
jgi:hypothetical protein